MAPLVVFLVTEARASFPGVGGRRQSVVRCKKRSSRDAAGLGKGRKTCDAIGKPAEVSQLKPSPRSENRGNQDQIFSIFIDNLPVDLDNLDLKTLFSGYGVIMDAYVPNKFGRRSGRKYRFMRFGEKENDEKAIEGMNGKFVGGHKLDVAWARFQEARSEA